MICATGSSEMWKSAIGTEEDCEATAIIFWFWGRFSWVANRRAYGGSLPTFGAVILNRDNAHVYASRRTKICSPSDQMAARNGPVDKMKIGQPTTRRCPGATYDQKKYVSKLLRYVRREEEQTCLLSTFLKNFIFQGWNFILNKLYLKVATPCTKPFAYVSTHTILKAGRLL